MPWIKRELRGTPVFVQTDGAGSPDVDGHGRVEIRYKLSPAAKAYRAYAKNLVPTGNADDEKPVEADLSVPPTDRPDAGSPPAPAGDAIIIYTDGACTGNPGPAGIGVVITDGEKRDEISEYLGQGTNNIAELTAILRALESIPQSERGRAVILHSDSSYSLGLLTKGWKAKANTELVARLRRLVANFPRIRFVKVKGHAGIPENERCDQLGRDAITRGH